jgi:hypothetical protein
MSYLCLAIIYLTISSGGPKGIRYQTLIANKPPAKTKMIISVINIIALLPALRFSLNIPEINHTNPAEKNKAGIPDRRATKTIAQGLVKKSIQNNALSIKDLS